MGSLWVANQAIPALLVSLAVKLQGGAFESLPAIEQELIGVSAQVLQLAATVAILRYATAAHTPLPAPWFEFRLDSWGVMLGGAAAVAAAGGGVLVVSALSHMQANGVGECCLLSCTLLQPSKTIEVNSVHPSAPLPLPLST